MAVTALVKSGLPPGPIAPAPLQTLRTLRDPYGFLLDCHRRYGDCFTLRLIPFGTMVYVADLDAVRMLFADPRTGGGAINAFMKPLLGDGLLTMDGESHSAHRKILAPLFAPQRIRAYESMIAAETEREIATWSAGEQALHPMFERLTLRVMRRILFGDLPGLEPQVMKLKQRSLIEGAAAIVAQKVGVRTRISRAADELDRTVRDEIVRRRVAATTLRSEPIEGSTDVLGALLATSLDDRAIRDELLTLLFAGHETTATTLAWLVERVVRHPAILSRLAAGADDTYVDAVIKETMRARSCLPDVGRTLVEPTQIGRWHLPAGTQVFPAIVPIHMRADLYAEPEAFRPERFIDRQLEPWAFLPFGGGARRCLGGALAMLEMRVIVQTLFTRVRLRATTAAPERATSNGIAIAPHDGARAHLELR